MFLFKGKDKSQIKDKTDLNAMVIDNSCTCGSDKLGALACNSANCVKLRESTMPRVATASNQISLKYDLPFNYKRLNDNTGSCFSLEKQSSVGLNSAANAPGPPKDAIKVRF